MCLKIGLVFGALEWTLSCSLVVVFDFGRSIDGVGFEMNSVALTFVFACACAGADINFSATASVLVVVLVASAVRVPVVVLRAKRKRPPPLSPSSAWSS